MRRPRSVVALAWIRCRFVDVIRSVYIEWGAKCPAPGSEGLWGSLKVGKWMLKEVAQAMNVKQRFDLTGRVAVVTGGSIGLGRRMAEGLAEMSANLVLCARKRNAASRLRRNCRPSA